MSSTTRLPGPYTHGEKKETEPYNVRRSSSVWAPDSHAETVFTLLLVFNFAQVVQNLLFTFSLSPFFASLSLNCNFF